MNSILRFIALPLLTTLVMLGGLYLSTDGRLDRHFHGNIVDRSQQASIHVVVMKSGFRLQQEIDTSDFRHVRQRLRNAPMCIWLRMEYPRNAPEWNTSGTIEIRLFTPQDAWATRFRSEVITTYFQPFCFKDLSADKIIDQPLKLKMSVVEPALENVAMIALGPANGRNNAYINGVRSEHTATYIFTADPDPNFDEIARFVLIGISTLMLLLCILIPLTGRKTQPRPVHLSSSSQEGNTP